MANRLVLPLPFFRNILLKLAEFPDTLFYFPVGIHQRKLSGICYLARGSELVTTPNLPGRYFCVSASADSLSLGDWVGLDPSPATGRLVLASGKDIVGNWWGAVVDAKGDLQPLHELALIGSQMPVLAMSEWQSISKNTASVDIPSGGIEAQYYHLWSRTIGALGRETWQTLHRLRVAVVGCGRLGSVVAVTLARMGVRHLLLIDPDTVECHNIPEMDGLTASDVGRPKAEALASFIKSNCDFAPAAKDVSFLVAPLISVYREAIEADVLVSCVDNDTARLSCAILAAAYHKVLLDIGTGVLPNADLADVNALSDSTGTAASSTTMQVRCGSDIRLIVPGHGCLRCAGSLVHYDEAVRELAKLSPPAHEPWWQERAGSLRTLNMTAAHLGLQLLFDFLAGRVMQIRWIQLEYGAHGEIHLHQQDYSADAACPLCVQAGVGDDGICW